MVKELNLFRELLINIRRKKHSKTSEEKDVEKEQSEQPDADLEIDKIVKQVK